MNHEIADYELCISTDGSMDHRWYNKPTEHGKDKVATFVPGSEQDPNITDSVEVHAYRCTNTIVRVQR